MPSFALSDGRVIDWTQTRTFDYTALQVFESWATELGVLSDPSEQNIEGDDEAFDITLAAPFFPGQTARCFISSEGGLGLHATAPALTGPVNYYLSGVPRFFGSETRPTLLLTFRSNNAAANLITENARLHRVGNTTIAYLELRQYNSTSYRTWVALRIEPSSIEIRADALAASNFYIFELDPTQSSEVVVGSAPLLLNVSAQTHHFTFDLIDPVVPTEILGAADTPLGSPAGVLAAVPSVIASAPAVIGAPSAVLLNDFTALLGATVTQYVMDLITPGGVVRVPIGSWQATLQADAASYVQCTVPATSAWIDALDAATEFVISRRAFAPSGAGVEYEMARAPAQTVRFDRGPQRHTCTLSGYAAALVLAGEAPPAAYDRTLQGVRSISSGSGGVRVRCAIDWLLRPGHRAIAEGAPFVVSYINFYVNGADAYSDVGERVV